MEKPKHIKEQKECVLHILTAMVELDNVLTGQMNQSMNKQKLHVYLSFDKLYGIL